jgi:hypothetical protein
MRFDGRLLLKPIIALGVLVLIVAQTQGALKRSGVWARPKPVHVAEVGDPFGQLDHDLARIDSGAAPPVRDPLAFAGGPVTRLAASAGRARPAAPAASSPSPILTAIVWDADPTASIRLAGHDYTVRVNSLFADYLVTSIARDQVVLSHDGAALVLKLPSKGDSE